MKKTKGYIGLVSVLIVGAVGTVIAVSTLLFGIANSRSSFSLIQSHQAKAMANACAEVGLQKIRDNLLYNGVGTLSLGQGSCSYQVTKGTGQNRSVTSQGIVGNVVRRVSISISQINPRIVLGSWQEVP